MPVGVEYGVRRSGRGVKLVLLNVKRVPAGATVTVRCTGARCPRGTIRRKLVLNTDVVALKRYFRKSVFRGKATVTVRVTHQELLGKEVALTIGRRGQVSSHVSCLAPGTGATVSC